MSEDSVRGNAFGTAATARQPQTSPQLLLDDLGSGATERLISVVTTESAEAGKK